MDYGWWPYPHLKPAKSEAISLKHLTKMSVYYGGTFGSILGILLAVLSDGVWGLAHTRAILNIVLLTIITVPLFFVGWGMIFGLAWNSRARFLARERAN